MTTPFLHIAFFKRMPTWRAHHQRVQRWAPLLLLVGWASLVPLVFGILGFGVFGFRVWFVRVFGFRVWAF